MDKTILIVDDSTAIRIVLKEIFLDELGDQNVELLLAADGEEGLNLALTERPDLVFLDVNMPGINGYEACQRIKAVDDGIYVILLTGEMTDREHGIKTGADECIVKPFDPDQILERAATVLGLDRQTYDPGRASPDSAGGPPAKYL